MFLTPKSGSGQMRFAIKNGGAEQQLNSAAPLANNKWVHVAVTLSPTSAKLYIDGVLDTESTSVTIRPLDFKPVLNYIGRSRFTDPLFNGYVDDFRIYNYALSDTEIALISNLSSGTNTIKSDSERYLSVYPNPVSEVLKIRNSSANNTLKTNLSLSDISGKTVLNRTINQEFTEINVSELPEGVYFLRLNNSKETLIQKVVVKR